MDYLVVRLNGSQYKVCEGEVFRVDKIKTAKVQPEILLRVKNGKVELGTPTVSSSTTKLNILDDMVKGEKIHVMKFKAKSRYRKRVGFRPQYSRLQLGKI